MMLKSIFILIGSFLGIVIGFLPGMSVNNLYPLILSLKFIEKDFLILFITSLAISQILAQFFPSIFLGAPNESTSISVLPGHELLLKGRGYEALKICLISSSLSLIFSSILIFLFQEFFRQIYYNIREYIIYPLIFIVSFCIISEKNVKKIIFSLIIFLLSGILGLLVFNSPFPSSNLMLPLLSGFFGLSNLIISLREKSHLPKQKIDEKIYIEKKHLINFSFLGTILGLIVGFLPGAGISQAAIFAHTLLGINDARLFLVTISSITIANEIFSLNSLYLVGNPRSGTSVALQRIVEEIDFLTFFLLVSSIFLSFGISLPLILCFSKRIYKFIVKIDYTKLNLTIIFFLFILVYLFTGLFGIIVFVTSGSIGILAIELKVRRSHCMGCLLLPSLLFFSGMTNIVLQFLFP